MIYKRDNNNFYKKEKLEWKENKLCKMNKK